VGDGVTSLKEPRPNVLSEFTYRNGDAEAVLAASDDVFEDRFTFSRINHFNLEPYVNVARATGAQIELWSCNQDPFVLRNDIARIFGRPATLCVSMPAMSGAVSAARVSARWSRWLCYWR
jgi:CO/xanthine dehydrogenase Mo-binding subunit